MSDDNANILKALLKRIERKGGRAVTNHVSPGKLRDLAAQMSEYGRGGGDATHMYDAEIEAALRAAADDVDRLRKRVAWFDRYTPLGLTPEWVNTVAQDNDRLRAVIENAPHDWLCRAVDASGQLVNIHSCTCWKADAL